MTRLRRRLLILVVAGFLAAGAAYRGELDPTVVDAAYTDETSRFLSVDGARVHYRRHVSDQVPDDAPTLLLLHGTASSLHTWDGWVEELSPRFPILRLDLAGFGLTGADPSRDYSVERQIKIIKALLDELGLPRVAVAGNSLGGLIAWRLAVHDPDRVSHLVLVDAAGAGGTDSPTETRSFRMIDMAAWPGAAFWLTRLTPRFLIRRGLEQVYGDPSKVTDDLVARHHRLLLRQGNRQAMIDQMRSRGASGAAPPDYASIEAPTLILWGEADTWIPVEHGRRFANQLRNARLVIYPGIGHVPMEEIPRRSATDVADLLSSSP